MDKHPAHSLVLLSYKAVSVTQSSGPLLVVAGLERNMAAESGDRFAAYVEAPFRQPWGMRIGARPSRTIVSVG